MCSHYHNRKQESKQILNIVLRNLVPLIPAIFSVYNISLYLWKLWNFMRAWQLHSVLKPCFSTFQGWDIKPEFQSIAASRKEFSMKWAAAVGPVSQHFQCNYKTRLTKGLQSSRGYSCTWEKQVFCMLKYSPWCLMLFKQRAACFKQRCTDK